MFAYHIYPYVPAERGGGDYTTQRPTILTFDPQLMDSIPDLLKNPSGKPESKKAVVLDETESTIFVAIPKATNTAGVVSEIADWRKNTLDTRPQQIFAVKRDAVVSERMDSW